MNIFEPESSNHEDKDIDYETLYNAAKHGEVEAVQEMLNKGADVNFEYKEGKTILHAACLYGHIKVVKHLLQNGANIDHADNKGTSPIHFASMQCNDAIVNILLAYGANIGHTDNNGGTPLHYASIKCNDGGVKNLLLNGAYLSQINYDGFTALHFASMKGNVNVAEILLQHDLQSAMEFVNAKTSLGISSLHFAAQTGRLEVVKLLLKNGAIYNILDDEGKKPIDYSHFNNTISFLKLLKKLFELKNYDETVIINDLRKLTKDEYEAVMNARNRRENTLLLKAANYKKNNIIFELISSVKEIKLFNYKQKKLEYLKYTIDKIIKKVQMNALEKEQSIIFDYVPLEDITSKLIEFVNILAEKLQSNYSSKLHQGCIIGDLLAVKSIVKRGQSYLNPRKENINADIANLIRDFLKHKKLDSAETILRHWASCQQFRTFINFKTDDGSTALHMAAQFGHFDIVKYLLKYGAAYNIQNNHGQTAMNVATNHNVFMCLKLVDDLFRDPENCLNADKGKIQSLRKFGWFGITNARNCQNKTASFLVLESKYGEFLYEMIKKLEIDIKLLIRDPE